MPIKLWYRKRYIRPYGKRKFVFRSNIQCIINPGAFIKLNTFRFIRGKRPKRNVPRRSQPSFFDNWKYQIKGIENNQINNYGFNNSRCKP